MIFVPVGACVQVVDQPVKGANAAVARLESYKELETPEAIQGPWRLASEPEDPQYRSYLYITLSGYVHLPHDNVYPPFGWPQPSEYGHRLKINTLSARAWNFIDLGWLMDWREGRLTLLDDTTMEFRSWRSDHYSGLDRQERVETYKRVLPRPDPISWDFAVGRMLPPEPLVGKWEAVESNGPGERVEVEKRFAESTNLTVIRFTQAPHGGDASGTSETTWMGGRFVPWGSGRWWFRTGWGPTRRDALFELGADGILRVTPKALAESPHSAEPPPPPRTYRRIR